MLIVIVGLVFMLAVASYMLETGQPPTAAKMFSLLIPQSWQAAYGQTTTTVITPPNETKMSNPDVILAQDTIIINPDIILDRILDALAASRLEDYRIYENGSAVLTFRVMTGGTFSGVTSNRTIEVYTDKDSLALDQGGGYIYNSTGIYTADGSRKVIIPTYEPPIGYAANE